MSIADVRRNGGSIFVMTSALDLIGNTPMVDVSNLSPNPNVRLVAKLESQNPYGSVKDRIARKMIDEAERSGALKPGGVLVLQGYTPEQLAYGTGGPREVSHLYTRELLEASFGDMDIVTLESYERELDEGPGHRGHSALIDRKSVV